MAGTCISTNLWNDSWFENLNWKEKLVCLYLLTCNGNASVKRISFETGLSKRDVMNSLPSTVRAVTIENDIAIMNPDFPYGYDENGGL